MNIVAGSIQHESNSFCPKLAAYEDFDISYGDNILDKIALFRYFRQKGISVYPTLYANSVPSGTVGRKCFERLLDDMLGRFPSEDTIDGVWLRLHGAMEVEDIGSGDTAIVAAVRREVGPRVPIAVALDFHANNTDEIAQDANIICGYRTAPHTDMEETQLRTARHLINSIQRRELPRTVIIRVPVIITGDKVITTQEPMHSIIEKTVRLEEEEGILDASVFNGQPWVDAENNGASVAVVAQSEEYYNRAMEHACSLARMLWNARSQYRFQVDARDAGEAISLAMKEDKGPVFITDSGDNTTAGAPGNNAFLLKQMIQAGVRCSLVAGITDPDAIMKCRMLKKGDPVSLSLGGTTDPLAESVRVDAVFCHRARMLGWDGEDAGNAVVLKVPGIDIMVTEEPCAVVSPQIIESGGVHPSDYHIIAIKMGYLWPELSEIAAKSILALTPGVSCEAVERMTFKRIHRPSWPMDAPFNWDPDDQRK